jgi:putative tricarboxylic transport membrane protein
MGEILLTATIAIFTVKNMLFMLFGVSAGMIAGALPGLTATMSVALIVPFTFTMDPVSGLVTLGAIYCGAIFGGAFSAILVNTPGTPSSIGTTFDGYPMAKQGKGEEAIFTATFASAGGGIIGTFILIFLSVPLARVALRFGPPEYFWITVFGLTIIASLASKNILKGLAGGAFGLLISMIGIAPIGGDVRFTMGMPAFQGGVQLISILIGFFCIPEMLRIAGNLQKQKMQAVNVEKQTGVLKRSFLNVFEKPMNFIRSSIIGAFVGILPGAGGNIANLVAYNEAQRASKEPETFGTGNPQGVVATEAANNATVEGGMVPLLTLGIPGAPPAAIIYGALMLQGLRPGPELFSGNAHITYAFMLSFLVANIMMFVVGILGGRSIFKIVTIIPAKILVPSIIFLTILGSYSIRNNIMDVIVMLVGGFVGYLLKELNFHPGPIVLGLILGPIAEKGLVQGYLMGLSRPNPWTIFFTRPISIVLIIITLLSAGWPIYRELRSKLQEGEN